MSFRRWITARAWELGVLAGYAFALEGFTSWCFNAINNFRAPTVPSTPPTYLSPPLPCIHLHVHSAEAWIELGRERKKLPSLQTMSPLTNIKFSWYPHARLLVVCTPKSVALWGWGDTSWKPINVEESEIEKTFFGEDTMNNNPEEEEVTNGLSLEVVFEGPPNSGRLMKFSLVITATLIVATMLAKQPKKNKKLTKE